jgi:hypothetical protein
VTTVDIDEGDLRQGLIGLVVAIVEIVADALELQAIRRMDGGSLSDVEIDRLGEALMDLDQALAQLKVDMGVEEAVRSVRDGLDQVARDLVDSEVLNRVAG